MVNQEIGSFDKLRDLTESLLRLKERISHEILASLISGPHPPDGENQTESDDCDLEESKLTSRLIRQLEELTEQTDRTKVLLGLIDLQAVMDGRLNQLFQADCSTPIGRHPSRY